MWKSLLDRAKSISRSVLEILISVVMARVDSKTENILAKALFTMAAAVTGFIGGAAYTIDRQKKANFLAAKRGKDTEDEVNSLPNGAAIDELRRDFSESD